jgi:hypothetical protein
MYSLKEIEAKILKADGSKVSIGTVLNQLRNLHAKGILRNADLSGVPNRLDYRAVEFDDEGLAWARLFQKLIQIGIETRLLKSVCDDIKISDAISKYREGAKQFFVVQQLGDQGASIINFKICDTLEQCLESDLQVHSATVLPLTKLFDNYL